MKDLEELVDRIMQKVMLVDDVLGEGSLDTPAALDIRMIFRHILEDTGTDGNDRDTIPETTRKVLARWSFDFLKLGMPFIYRSWLKTLHEECVKNGAWGVSDRHLYGFIYRVLLHSNHAVLESLGTPCYNLYTGEADYPCDEWGVWNDAVTVCRELEYVLG